MLKRALTAAMVPPREGFGTLVESSRWAVGWPAGEFLRIRGSLRVRREARKLLGFSCPFLGAREGGGGKLIVYPKNSVEHQKIATSDQQLRPQDSGPNEVRER